MDSTLAPPRGTTWGDVTATATPRKFIVATSPANRADWNPSRLYTLTLSARGAVTHLTPLAVGLLPVQNISLAADADGGVIAFSGQRSSGLFVVGAVIGNQIKQWSVSDSQAVPGGVSVTSAGTKIAFLAQYNGPGSHFAAMVLATGSAPGPLLSRAKTVGSYDYPRKDLYMFSEAISPDGNWVYVVTRPILPLGANLPTTLTAYSTSRPSGPAARQTSPARSDRAQIIRFFARGSVPGTCHPSGSAALSVVADCATEPLFLPSRHRRPRFVSRLAG